MNPNREKILFLSLPRPIGLIVTVRRTRDAVNG